MSDITMPIACINTKGRVKYLECNDIAKEIWF